MAAQRLIVTIISFVIHNTQKIQHGTFKKHWKNS